MPFKIVYIDDEPSLCETFVDNLSSFVDSQMGVDAVRADGGWLLFLDFHLTNTNSHEKFPFTYPSS